MTPNQYREFLNVNANEVAPRRAFLDTEGIQTFSGPQAAQAAGTMEFQDVFSAVAPQQGRADAALVAFARATGYEAVTMERKLVNFIKLTLQDPSIPIRRVQ